MPAPLQTLKAKSERSPASHSNCPSGGLRASAPALAFRLRSMLDTTHFLKSCQFLLGDYMNQMCHRLRDKNGAVTHYIEGDKIYDSNGTHVQDLRDGNNYTRGTDELIGHIEKTPAFDV
jgi:hypothetical protein